MCDWYHTPDFQNRVTLYPSCGCFIGLCTACFIMLRGKTPWRALKCSLCGEIVYTNTMVYG